MYKHMYDLLITCNRHFVGLEGQKHHWRQEKKNRGGEGQNKIQSKTFIFFIIIYLYYICPSSTIPVDK